MDTSVRLFDQR